MRKLLKYIAALGILALLGFWVLTRPGGLSPDQIATLSGHSGDVVQGESVFWAGGCASCHAAPGAEGDARLVLAGGQRFASPFGTFLAPNISPDPTHGIGGWSLPELANAMIHGVSPDGAHYYPAFPYTSYARADLADIADLHAFLMTLPAASVPSPDHDVGFPFNIRRGLGLWKRLYARNSNWLVEVKGNDATRGRYLVESLGHCGECHTPRDALGGLETARWLSGAPIPGTTGRTPAITPDKLDWSTGDIAAYLSTGFTPEYDSAGGHMAEVVQNYAHLPHSDLEAIASYLKQVPPSAGGDQPGN